MSSVEEGSSIKIDYVALIDDEENGEQIAFDTTIKDIAIENAIYDEKKAYEPMLLVLGYEWFPKKVEEGLVGAEPNQDIEIKISAEDAFGLRDPSRIKLVARREFQKMQVNPQKGEWVKVGKKLGRVLSVSAGRVRVDFNHKLAGKNLIYKITIKQILVSHEDRIQAIIGRRLPGADLADAVIDVNGDTVTIALPKRVTYFEYIQFAKQAIAIDIKNIVAEFKYVRFTETFDLETLES